MYVALTFLKAQLILSAGLEIVESDEKLRIVFLLLGKEVFFRGPSVGCFQRGRGRRCKRGWSTGTATTTARSGSGCCRSTSAAWNTQRRVAVGQVRNMRQGPALK